MDLAAFTYKEQEIKATGRLKLPQFRTFVCLVMQRVLGSLVRKWAQHRNLFFHKQ